MKPASDFLLRPVLRFVVLTLAALAFATQLPAQSTVLTVTRKPASSSNYGYVNGLTGSAAFNGPEALVLNTGATLMFVADYTNNAIRQITMPPDSATSETTTFTNNNWPTNKVINHPIDVAVDGADNLYVLNWAGGTNGFVAEFNQYANFLGYLATNLVNPTAFAFDGSTNLYVTIHSNTVIEITAGADYTLGIIITNYATNSFGVVTTNVLGAISNSIVGVVSNPGTKLDGIAIMDDGLIALADGNTNGGIRLLNPASGTNTILTGFNGMGDTPGTAPFAQFKSIAKIAKAGGGTLVVADWGNGRVKLVDQYGTSTVLFGVATNQWDPVVPGWIDGPGIGYPAPGQGAAAARNPYGLIVDAAGNVYDSEGYYDVIRMVTGTGLTGPGGVNSGSGTLSTNTTGTATNTAPTITTPVILPNTGYFPMGQTITVQSPYANVYYTTDGSLPTTNSPQVAMNANVGSIVWDNSVSDLTSLNVAAFSGTNFSLAASGVPALTNSVGVPTGRYPDILAGVGATILVPVVFNLDTNDQVESFQFRVEIAPNVITNISVTSIITNVLGTNITYTTNFATNFNVPPSLPYDIGALSISTNDFVPVTTSAQNGQTALYSVEPYTFTNIFNVTNVVATNGLIVSAIGTNSNVSFTRYAVVAMLTVTIPGNAVVGDTYNVQVLDPSATSDGDQTAVTLGAAPATTILVTNVAYTVGSVDPGSWYNAGDFGNGNLANNDVNTIFYTSVGLHVPDAYSDVFNAMDAFPVDGPGFVGGDGQIRFLDWQVIFDRSLRLDTNNYVRAWSSGGMRTNNITQLITPAVESAATAAQSPPGQVWYKQAKIGAAWGTNGAPGSIANIPVYLRVITGANVSGMEFRAIVSPNNDVTPGVAQTLQFIPAAGIPVPTGLESDISNQDSEISCGWPFGSFAASALSSNLLGWLEVPIPANATPGESYTVHFANVDGAPAPYSVNNAEYTEYNFESCSAVINVGNAPAPTPDGISDEWKIQFFGSVNNPLAAANADPDGDGSPNWQEYLNGTDPTSAASYLHLIPGTVQTNSAQPFIPFQWLSAPGKIYAVERASSLASPNWSTVLTLTGDGYQHQYNETNLISTAAFYRVLVTAP
jgi:hypothetical protein